MRLSISTLLRLAPLLRLRPVLATSPRIVTNANTVSPLTYTTATPHAAAAAMASDQAYLDFLNRANEDPAAGRAHAAADATPADKPFKTLDEGASVPKDIAEATRGDDLLYTSDADEPFQPVALQWEDPHDAGLPSESAWREGIPSFFRDTCANVVPLPPPRRVCKAHRPLGPLVGADRDPGPGRLGPARTVPRAARGGAERRRGQRRARVPRRAERHARRVLARRARGRRRGQEAHRGCQGAGGGELRARQDLFFFFFFVRGGMGMWRGHHGYR
jgi:hypothetical protein